LVVGLISLQNNNYALWVIFGFFVLVCLWFVSSLYSSIDFNTKQIKRLNETLKIQNGLIDIKANLRVLNKEVCKR